MNEVLVQGLRQDDGFQIVHFDSGDSRGNASRLKFDLVNVGVGFLDLARLIKKILANRPDIVYIPISKNITPFLRDSLYVVSSWLLGAKVVSTLHGGEFNLSTGNRLKRTLVRFVLKKIHTLSVLGENIKQQLESRLPVQNLAVLYNGIDPIAQVKSKRVKQRNERFHVLFIGNLRESKGIFDVLKAASLVRQETDRVDFWFAGEWSSDQAENYALDIIRRGGIEEHIKFWGLITGEEKVEFFNRGDVLVHPTYYDGQPIVLLEAMSVGLPIISTDVGSIAETVIDNQNGFIIPTGSPDKMAERILLFSRDDKLRRSMSRMSKKIYENRFTRAIFLTNARQILREVYLEKTHKHQNRGVGQIDQ